MSSTNRATEPASGVTTGISTKGLSAGTVGLIGAVVIGISCIAPAYTFTAAVGPTASEVGAQIPAIILVGFIPMLLVAFGYRELNNRMPDSGTSFTWAARAFGPWVGWMAGWGLVVATILVLSNLAGVAVDFLFLLLSQITGNAEIADLAGVTWINIGVCLLFMLGATWVSYRDMQTTQKLQYWLVGFQILVLVFFAVAAIVQAVGGNGFDYQPFDLNWFNPFAISSFSAVAAGLSLSIFIFWGWDVTLTMNEETKDPEKTPGRAATVTVLTIVSLYLLLAVAMIMFAGVGTGSSASATATSRRTCSSTSPGRSSAARVPRLPRGAHELGVVAAVDVRRSGAHPARDGSLRRAAEVVREGEPRFFTPGYATIVSAIVASAFYAVMRVVSEDTLWDTILTLGMMICFYYGITAFACVWYFRKQWFDSARNVFFTFLFPLVGGIILAILFFTTLIDSMDPAYGSGSEIGGIGIVFILGILIIVVGIAVMIWNAIRRPAFFRGETLGMDAPPSRRRRPTSV